MGKAYLYMALYALGLFLVFWFVLAVIVWPWRNPLGGEATFWLHLPSAMQFKALPQFQEKP